MDGQTDGRTDGHLCSGYTSACIARYANALVKTNETLKSMRGMHDWPLAALRGGLCW